MSEHRVEGSFPARPRGAALTAAEKADVLRVYFKCKEEWKQYLSTFRVAPRERTAHYLDISPMTVSHLLREWRSAGAVRSGRRGNFTERETGLPVQIGQVVREFVLQRAEERRLVSATDLCRMLNERFPQLGMMPRRAERLMHKLGFTYDVVPQKGVNYHETVEAVEKRQRFFAELDGYRADATWQFVYTDESYCHLTHSTRRGWMEPGHGVAR